MRTDVKVATLSLAVFLGACNTRQEQATGLSEDLKKDLAVASATSDLATAPKSYQRARFVSEVEMSSRTKLPAPKLVASKRRTKPVRRPVPTTRPPNDVVEEPNVASNEELAPAVTATPAAASAPEPVVIVQQPTTETAPDPSPVNPGRGDDGRSVGEGGIGERRRGGGVGGMLGGIIGAVVIRGGHGGRDKCDPRTDGRRGGILVQRPDFGMPSPVGRPTFPSL